MSGKLESLGEVRYLLGHAVIDELEIGGNLVKRLRAPKGLVKHLVVGHEMSLFIQVFVDQGFLMGVSEDYSSHVIGVVFCLFTVIIAFAAVIACFLIGLVEARAYAGIPLFFYIGFWHGALLLKLIHFGH